jgi:hypothetical protein
VTCAGAAATDTYFASRAIRPGDWRQESHLDEIAKGNINLIIQTLADVPLAECVQRCKPEADIGHITLR